AVDVERLGLPARAVEREHQLAAQPFPQRVCVHRRLEVLDELRVAAERELRLRPLLDQRQAELLEPSELLACEPLEGELGQRVAAPRGERLAEQTRAARRVGAARLVDEPADAREIQLRLVE